MPSLTRPRPKQPIYYTIRPTRQQLNNMKPCTPELTAVFNCWKGARIDGLECAHVMKGLKECVKNSKVGKKPDNSELNYHLNRIIRMG